MTHPIFDLAKKDKEAAEKRLLGSDLAETFRAYLRSSATMVEYEQVAEMAERRPAVEMGSGRRILYSNATEAGRVILGAQKLLRDEYKHMSSSEIARHLIKNGVQIKGAEESDKISRVSSHLSQAKKIFKNDRSKGGYGLLEWDAED